MILGSRIKELRKKKGLTQQQLADLINVTKVSICCYEKGNRTPNLETFIDLINVLDTTPEYLLGMDTKVAADGDGDYIINLPKEDIQIIQELRKNDKLINYLREDPVRGVKYIIKKTK
ncbi:MAG: helix-turn-helix transcriptional regulator [Bacilli bacterium]|nr:helix-turn-helix transcriptional regulator [Bacilli bacterium]